METIIVTNVGMAIMVTLGIVWILGFGVTMAYLAARETH